MEFTQHPPEGGDQSYSLHRKGTGIFGGVQPFSTTLFGVPFPQPAPQGCWLSNLKLKLEDVVRKGHEAPTRASRIGNLADLWIKECLGRKHKTAPPISDSLAW